jgi:hypothetical protein
MKSTPYTYLIGWSRISKYYYGVRYSKDCHPNDLWITYFTSSNLVKDLRQQHGDPDIIQVRRTFESRERAILWEHKVLTRLNILHESKWLNQSVGGVIAILQQSSEHIRKRTSNKNHHPRQREIALRALKKATAANIGKKQTEATQQKKRDTYRANIEKNKISAQRNPWCQYLIDGEVYVGNKAVMKTFNISEPTIYNRVKNPKYDWNRIDG